MYVPECKHTVLQTHVSGNYSYEKEIVINLGGQRFCVIFMCLLRGIIITVATVGGSKGGARDALPRGSKFFHFHAVFGKKHAK